MSQTALSGLSLDELWMPFTANKAFKARPRMLVGAKDIDRKSTRLNSSH